MFEGYPPAVRRPLLALRELIFQTAEATEGVGRLGEALRWGEPAYLTPETKSGTTVRLNWKAATPDHYRMLFHCQTTLVESFRLQYPHQLEFEGNRAIVFEAGARVPEREVRRCVADALTYHLGRSRGRR